MAEGSSGSLPAFGDPPLTETVLSVAFDPIPSFVQAHVGRFQPAHLPDHDQVSERSSYNMPIEMFGAAPQQVNFGFSVGTPPARTVISNSAGDELFQIQRDWFAFNWKRVGDITYPRYEACRARFFHGWHEFRSFAEQELGADPLKPSQAEVTYVNHIASPNSDGLGDPATLFTPVISVDLGPKVGPLEQASVAASAIINGENSPIGRLHISLSPAQMTPTDSGYVLNLTARGPVDGTDDGLRSFLDAGREAIVNGFAQLTTDEFQQKWRRQ